ncbi:alpha/beta hydrolase [Litorimonas sp.]|uniref:alpha/beta hydrolase n=1 Tax=Litorimonas sp. TaxID=1892381 RepID=UPI003A8A0949
MEQNKHKALVEKLSLVNVELRPALKTFTEFELNDENLTSIRCFPTPEPLPEPHYREVVIDCPDREGSLRMLIVDPVSDGQSRPAIVYLHGGGFVFGSPEHALPSMQKLAASVGCVIVLPEYRLAPEASYPAALNDNYLALSWIFKNAEDLRIDPSRIAIGGDSAGGGHAAILSISARDRGEYPIAFQLLVYPMLDDRTGKVTPPAEDTDYFIWSTKNNDYGWSAYLGGTSGAPCPSSRAVPARIRDLSNLPPTLIATGSLDLFARENAQFAQRLKEQGVDVAFKSFSGAYHGFNVMVPNADISKRFHQFCVEGLKGGLGIESHSD